LSVSVMCRNEILCLGLVLDLLHGQHYVGLASISEPFCDNLDYKIRLFVLSAVYEAFVIFLLYICTK